MAVAFGDKFCTADVVAVNTDDVATGASTEDVWVITGVGDSVTGDTVGATDTTGDMAGAVAADEPDVCEV